MSAKSCDWYPWTIFQCIPLMRTGYICMDSPQTKHRKVLSYHLYVVTWRRIERRQLSCVFLCLFYFFSRGLALSMGWGGVGRGINVMCRVRGTRSCLTRSWYSALHFFKELLTRSWCYAQHFSEQLLTRSWCYGQNSFLATSHTLLMLRSALLQGTSHTLLMLRSALLQGTSNTLLM